MSINEQQISGQWEPMYYEETICGHCGRSIFKGNPIHPTHIYRYKDAPYCSIKCAAEEEAEENYGAGWNDATPEYRAAIRENADRWVPACGGHEQPMRTRTGVMVLYCFNPRLREHGYINTATDIFLSEDELRAAGLEG